MQERRGARLSYTYQDVRRGHYAAPVGRQPAPPPPVAPRAEAPLTSIAKSRRKLITAGLIALIIIIVAGGAGLLLIKKGSNPVPKNIRQSVNFPIYYPSALPRGYQLDKNTFDVQNNIVFYNLVRSDNTIVISEQTSPPNPLDLKSSPGFNEVPSTAGEAAAGLINGVPVAILVTEKTMVNVQGSKDVSQDIVAKLAQSMSAPQ